MALEAVKSLARILEQMLQHQHIIVEDRKLAESLLKEVNSFRFILENSSEKSSEEIEFLRSQIIISANNSRDLIQSHIKPYRRLRSKIKITISSRCLEEVEGILSFTKESVSKIEEESQLEDLQPRISSSIDGLFEHGSTNGDISRVGLDDDLKEIKDRLVRGSQQLQIVAVVGMGGIGKTTLATKLFDDYDILNHFDIQTWATVSQSYDMPQTLINLLDSMKSLSEEMRQTTNVQIMKERLYKCLKGRRYLIVLDDVWDSKVWNDLKQIFPNDNINASRILFTTRLRNMAIQANFCYLHLLNDDKSWKLFCHKVFGRDYSPPKLKQIGKNIVRTCGGLPLAIVVLAGFLAKGPKTQQYWRSTVKSLSSEMLKNDEKCLTTVSLSYTHLPHHLKECFLYFGIFPEDSKIIVSELVMLWIAEGFIKPIKRKSLEDVAYEYLMDLVDRNLIMLGKKNSMGKIKVCKIHDLVRDFCIRELKNKELFYITDRSLCGIPVGAAVHLLSIYPDATNIFPCDRKKLSSLLVNSVVNFDPKFHISRQFQSQPVRVIDTLGRFPTYVKGEENVSKFYDLRYFACQYDLELFPSSSCLLQNLQTLILRGSTQTTLKEVAIWNMPKLRHVQVAGLKISDPLEGENSIEILEDLQTLSEVQNFRCSKEFVKRVPNLKKLGMCYRFDADLYHSLSNLADLQKLEELRCVGSYFSLPISMHNLTFPSSLRKLILDTCQLSGEDIHNIGCLPDLKVLKLKLVRFKGVEWEPADGGFLNLKYLLIHLTNLEHWKAASVHFPSLQHLILDSNHKLMEIPFCIGDIPTLQLIKLYDCTEPLVACVKNTRYELWESGIELQVNISYSGVRAKEGFVEGTSKFLELMEKVRERWPLLYNELVKESTKEQERTGGPLVNTKEDYAAKLGELREKLSESGLLLFNDSREYRSKALRDCLGIMGEEGLSLAMAIQAATKLPIERDDGRRG